MAQRIQKNTIPTTGYWTTDDFDTAVNFIIEFLQISKSIKLVLHTTATFLRDGEEINIHIPITIDTILDIDTLDAQNFFEEVFNKLTDPDEYPDAAGSGMSFINISGWWFTMAPCQPNNNVSPTSRNTLDTTITSVGVDDTDGRPTMVTMRLSQTLLGCIALHHVYNPGMNANQRRKAVRRWLLEELLMDNTEWVHISELPAWHRTTDRFNIRVFNSRGNVLYSKQYDPKSKDFINLYYVQSRKYKLIIQLDAFLKDKTKENRRFCDKCNKYHAPNKCEVRISTLAFGTTNDVCATEKPKCLHSLVCYADFEAYIDRHTKQHIPSGYCWMAIYKSEVIKENMASLRNVNDVAQHFVTNIASFIYDWSVAIGSFTNNCIICGNVINDKEERVDERRNYIDGNSGSSHLRCWMTPENSCPVYFHNFRGYDSHLIVRELIRRFSTAVQVSAKNFEKFDRLFVNTKRYKINFLDTFNYLSAPLSKLASTVSRFCYTPQDVNTKAPFPYEWFDSPEKLTVELPTEDEFWYSHIRGEQQNKNLALQVWNKMNFKVFEEYHNYYLKLDVQLLTDVFELFRHNAYCAYKVDPVYFQGAPSFTWHCALQANPGMFKVIQNSDLYVLIQGQIRGGVSQCSKRHAIVSDNNTEHILYIDINSLYSHVMSSKLPVALISKLDSLPEDWCNWTAQTGRCFFALIDLTYPKELHDKHCEFPLCPHHVEGRLCTTYFDKTEYLVHNLTLNYYVQQGLIITKVHAVWIFSQDYVFKTYVTKNIERRQIHSDNKALSEMYKLVNNSLFGKTLENPFKYKKFSVRQAQQNSSSGRINSFLSEVKNFIPIDDYFLCELENKNICLNRPVQLGFAILELAKLEVYRFFYKLKTKFNEKMELLYHDTDSLILYFYDCNTHPLLTMSEDSDLRACLDYERAPANFVIHTQGTHKVPGLWADEVQHRKILEFVGLRAKTYALRFEDDKFLLKNKGVRSVSTVMETNKLIDFDDYKRCLFNNVPLYVQEYHIRSRQHTLYTVKQNKLALISEDRKRKVLPDKIRTLPHGYSGVKYQ